MRPPFRGRGGPPGRGGPMRGRGGPMSGRGGPIPGRGGPIPGRGGPIPGRGGPIRGRGGPPPPVPSRGAASVTRGAANIPSRGAARGAANIRSRGAVARGRGAANIPSRGAVTRGRGAATIRGRGASVATRGTARKSPGRAARGTYEEVPKSARKKKRGTSTFRCKIFTIIYLIAIVEGAGIITCYFMFALGLGATFVSVEARNKLLVSCVFAAALGLAGYIILNKELRSIILGITYLFMVIWALFTSLYALSRSLHTYRKENINHIINYTKYTWENSSLETKSIPQFVENFQTSKDCCGWGEFYWTSWSRELNTSDLPRSCCAAVEGESRGAENCGRGLVPRRPSGFLSILSASQYKKLSGTLNDTVKIPKTNRQRLRQEKVNALFLRLDISNTSTPPVPPPWLLREVDEELAYDYYKKDWKERFTRSHRFRFEEIKVRIYPVHYEPNFEEDPDISIRAIMYTTQGLEELQRIQKFIRPKACAPANCRDPTLQTFERCVDPTDPANDAIMVTLRGWMIFIQFFAIGLMSTFLIMFLVHWYYFSILKTREIAENDELPEFQRLDTKPVVEIDEVLKGDVNEESKAKIRLAQSKRKDRQRKFQLEKQRLKEKHEAAVKAATEARIKLRLEQALKAQTLAKQAIKEKNAEKAAAKPKENAEKGAAKAKDKDHKDHKDHHKDTKDKDKKPNVAANTVLIISQEARIARDELMKEKRDDDPNNNN